MDAPSEAAVSALRAELSALDYREPLGAESAPLAARLLQDLVLATEAYESLRAQAERAERAAGAARDDAAPLRKDASRLVRENNEVRGRAGAAVGTPPPLLISFLASAEPTPARPGAAL